MCGSVLWVPRSLEDRSGMCTWSLLPTLGIPSRALSLWHFSLKPVISKKQDHSSLGHLCPQHRAECMA